LLTTTRLRRPSARGRATAAGTSVTSPIQCDDNPGVNRGTLTIRRRRPSSRANRSIISR
jgi:hypothetical protein